MAESDICIFDTNKKAFVIGDPNAPGLNSFSELPPSKSPPTNANTASVFDGLDSHTVQVLAAPGFGSGFGFNELDKVSTDAHVALFNRQLFVKTPSGKTLDATVEKLDLATDTAILDVPGLANEGVKPVDINPNWSSADGEAGFAVGFVPPLGIKCIAAGIVVSAEKEPNAVLSAPEHQKYLDGLAAYWEPNAPGAAELIYRHQREYQSLADMFATRPQIFSNIVSFQGESGGPTALLSKRVIGIADYVHGSANWLVSTPIKSVLDVANRPSRFKFEYDQGPHHVLRRVEAINDDDRYEAALANAILDKRVKNSLWPGTPVGP